MLGIAAEQLDALYRAFPVAHHPHLHDRRHQALNRVSHPVIGIVTAPQVAFGDDVLSRFLDAIPGMGEQLVVNPPVVQGERRHLDQVNQFPRLDERAFGRPGFQRAINDSAFHNIVA